MLQYDRIKVGAHLKHCRERANLTQSQVSEALGYSSSQFISNIELGVSVAPIGVLAKVMRLYKTNPSVLEKIILQSQKVLLLAKLNLKSSKYPKKRDEPKTK